MTKVNPVFSEKDCVKIVQLPRSVRPVRGKIALLAIRVARTVHELTMPEVGV
jgi:hypothetical protein